eukprot:16435_1
MKATLIVISIISNIVNTTIKLLYAASTWSHGQIIHSQNDQFTNFAQSPLFGVVHQKLNGQNIHSIFENLTSFQFIKSQSVYIALSPYQRFMAIGNILGHLYAHEWTIQKSWFMFHEITSEIMGIIFGSYFIWLMYKETTNIAFLTSARSLAYTKMTIGNMQISHGMTFMMSNIEIGSI